MFSIKEMELSDEAAFVEFERRYKAGGVFECDHGDKKMFWINL